MADGIQDVQHRTLVIKLDFKQRVVTGNHCCVDAFVIPEQQFSARLRRFRCANMCQNTFIIEHTLDQDFNLAAAGFTAKQARRDHAGIIKDQQIARVELVEQIGESTVRQRARWPIQRQQAATAAFWLWIVGNQGIWQFKREIGNAHDLYS
ncbi:hypothetical protein HMPREF0880_02280 [Yokenella regensburgei ATCC 43003]|nr:hypothetical protein HMPREF0880_02280 [Yokenella regensburgei ATCC 43003]